MHEDKVMKVVRQGVARKIELLKELIEETDDLQKRRQIENQLKKFEKLVGEIEKR